MTEFQNLCYNTLQQQVSKGRVISYGDLAKLIGRTKAYRVVGSAVNKNPYAPNVPCHWVVKSSGELGGFAQDIYKSKTPSSRRRFN